MDFDSLQPDPAQTPDTQSAPVVAAPSSGTTSLSFDSLQPDKPTLAGAEYQDNPLRELGTAAEGVGQGLFGPVATLAERGAGALGVPGFKPEEIQARKEDYPWTYNTAESSSLLGSLVAGTGLLGAGAKAAEAYTQLGALGKVASFIPEGAGFLAKTASSALSGALQSFGLQAGSEATKWMLGQEDPEAPVASSLANGLKAAAFGGAFGVGAGALGAGLGALNEAEASTRGARWLQEMGQKAAYRQTFPDPLSAVTQELTTFHNAVNGASNELYGVGNLKDQLVDKLSADVTPEQVQSHVNNVQKMVSKAPKDFTADPRFVRAFNDWQAKVTPQVDSLTNSPSFNPSAADTFKATDQFKKTLQSFSKYDRNVAPSELPFIQDAQAFNPQLRKSLEDPGTWGELGNVQKRVNGLVSNMINPLNEFNGKFTEKLGQEPQVQGGKVNTYLNQEGKPSAGFKPIKLKNFVDAGSDFLDGISDVYKQHGIESPTEPIPMNATQGTYGEQTSGGKFIDNLYDKGIPALTSVVTKAAGSAVGSHYGGTEGAVEGFFGAGPVKAVLDAFVGHPIQNRLKQIYVPALLNALRTGATDGISNVVNHAGDVASGVEKINRGLEGLFRLGSQQALDLEATDKEQEKIKKYIKQGGVNAQINQIHPAPSAAPSPLPVQTFAEGGMVGQKGPSFSKSMPAPLENPLFKASRGMDRALPAQNMMMQAAKSRISNYLGSLQPVENPPGLPFDRKAVDPEQSRAYDRAIHTAAQPLSVLNDIKTGTLTAEKMKHFTGLYPELHSHLSQKISQKIVDQQLSEDKVPYKTRQAMSLFLGQPLDSTMTPTSIQSIQGVYAQKGAAPQQLGAQGKPKKGSPSKLKELSSTLATNDQARQQRMNST